MAKSGKFFFSSPLKGARKLTVSAATDGEPTVPPPPYTEQAKALYEQALKRHREEQTERTETGTKPRRPKK